MVQISATIENSTNAMLKAYADFHGLSFSRAVAIMTSKSVNEWFCNFTEDEKKEYNRKYKIFKPLKK